MMMFAFGFIVGLCVLPMLVVYQDGWPQQ